MNEVTLNPLECALNEAQVLRKQVDALQAENVKLRQELAIRKVSEQEKVIECLRQENIDWEDKYRALASENAKLRELVRHLYEYRQLYFKTGIYPTDHGVTERRMRELSVEADA